MVCWWGNLTPKALLMDGLDEKAPDATETSRRAPIFFVGQVGIKGGDSKLHRDNRSRFAINWGVFFLNCDLCGEWLHQLDKMKALKIFISQYLDLEPETRFNREVVTRWVGDSSVHPEKQIKASGLGSVIFCKYRLLTGQQLQNQDG